ncbi:MCE family protein [Candidatus Sumerlaeota bacterium]|nr:MCE family protein [Candidatus Sumerlaeota bacterium]
MSAKVNYFKLGLFVIVAVGFLAIGVSILGVGSILRSKTLVETYVNESVQGLDIGSPVKYRGVHIGNVKQIGFVHTEYPELPASSPAIRYVLIRCVVYPEMLGGKGTTDVLPFLVHEVQKGLRARLALQGITGTVYLEVDYVDPERNPPLDIEWEPTTVYIPSVPSLTAQVGDMAISFLNEWEKANIPETLDSVRVFLEDADRAVKSFDLGQTREKTEQLIEELRQTNREVGQILGSAEFATAKGDAFAALSHARQLMEESSTNMEKILEDLRRGAEDFRQASSGVDRFLSGTGEGAPPLERLSRTAANLESASADMPETIARLNGTLQKLERLVSTKQNTIESILDNLDRTMQNMRDVSEDAKLYPSRVLFGDPPKSVEPGK